MNQLLLLYRNQPLQHHPHQISISIPLLIPTLLIIIPILIILIIIIIIILIIPQVIVIKRMILKIMPQVPLQQLLENKKRKRMKRKKRDICLNVIFVQIRPLIPQSPCVVTFIVGHVLLCGQNVPTNAPYVNLVSLKKKLYPFMPEGPNVKIPEKRIFLIVQQDIERNLHLNPAVPLGILKVLSVLVSSPVSPL